MPTSIAGLAERLERIAAYDGPWQPLRREAERLRPRIDELKRRERRLDDLLVVALVGGSGVGKSTLLNALAGDQLAETSEFRPCTAVPTVYMPPGARLDLAPEWRTVSGSALEHLVIIDTPDSDTVVREHRAIVEQALQQCDLILLCGSPEKYLDEATWSLLRPLRGERTMACVETKATEESESVRDHWLGRLREQGFDLAAYFCVSARRTLDRKLTGRPPGDDEFDWPRLDAFLREELSRERIARIKRSNAIGLLRKTLAELDEGVGTRADELAALREKLDAAERHLAGETTGLVRQRLFAEPYLWNYALGREVGLRAKGFVGGLFRLWEALRTLPVRAAGWLPWPVRPGAGRQAANLLSERPLLAEDLDLALLPMRSAYDSYHSQVQLECARAGFVFGTQADGFDAFAGEVQRRVAGVLRGPARERVVQRARVLTSWPLALLFDLPPVALIGWGGYRLVRIYLEGGQAGVLAAGNVQSFISLSLTVLALLLVVEIVVLSALTRVAAWDARNLSTRDLRVALGAGVAGFPEERQAIETAEERAREVRSLGQAAGESP